MSSHISPFFCNGSVCGENNINFSPAARQTVAPSALFYLTDANSEASETQDRDYEAKGGDREAVF